MGGWRDRRRVQLGSLAWRAPPSAYGISPRRGGGRKLGPTAVAVGGVSLGGRRNGGGSNSAVWRGVRPPSAYGISPRRGENIGAYGGCCGEVSLSGRPRQGRVRLGGLRWRAPPLCLRHLPLEGGENWGLRQLPSEGLVWAAGATEEGPTRRSEMACAPLCLRHLPPEGGEHWGLRRVLWGGEFERPAATGEGSTRRSEMACAPPLPTASPPGGGRKLGSTAVAVGEGEASASFRARPAGLCEQALVVGAGEALGGGV